MEDDFKNFKMEDDLKNFKNGRRPQKFQNGKQCMEKKKKARKKKVCVNNCQLRLQPPSQLVHASLLDQFSGKIFVWVVET